MRPLDWPILADENIDRRLVERLRRSGFDVSSVVELGLCGVSDTTVLAAARAEGRVGLTQDADFGTLVVRRGEPFIGIIYVRPGDLRPEVAGEMLGVLQRGEVDAVPPFIVVLQRRGDTTRVRIRGAS